MAEERLPTSRLFSKGFLKKQVKRLKEMFNRPQSRSSSSQPSASAQQIHEGEISSVQHTIISLGDQGPSSSVTVTQQDHRTSVCPSSDGAASSSPLQDHGTVGNNPANPTGIARSAVKDSAAVAFSFTTMLLKRLPDVVDINPAKIALGITKLVLQIRDVRSGSSHR
ncbi:hypothetical protein M413DRAFT_420191 [Hebeloma cylindrosporum]|uniref:Uncharacterized protein n=1 Tax=Hebeloma cylindrosporum TaxID=76867 RepID=A0A0C3BQ46_HEBCY|nr:hypothetical protein M413DRAFT_420191 [Hebeloma cylindrosporum h7]